MDASADAPRTSDLLTHDTLVMQQVTGWMSNDFDILDASGEHALGHVITTGSGLSRFFTGSRSLDVSAADGTALLHIEDPAGFGPDRYELSTPDGAPLAELRARFAIFSTTVGLELADGTELELHGDMFSLDYEFRRGDEIVARASRSWAGVSRGLLGHSRYVLGMEPPTPPRLRLAIIGGCVVLDLLRAKRARRNRASASS
jgi:uncharacterized protein YxjI